MPLSDNSVIHNTKHVKAVKGCKESTLSFTPLRFALFSVLLNINLEGVRAFVCMIYLEIRSEI